MPRGEPLKMSAGESGSGSGKKDLTGLHELPQADPVVQEGDSDFAVNEPAPIEKVDHFESLDQIGMMDHPIASEVPPPETYDPFNDTPIDAVTTETAPIDLLPSENLLEERSASESSEILSPLPEPDPVVITNDSPPAPLLDELRNYGESQKSAAFDPDVRIEFHLHVSGDFDPYARDKLLLFITDHPVGMTSSELDFQIQAGRVLLPRISEFSGIKLIQELRDSGLEFRLLPSSTDPVFESEPKMIHFGEPEKSPQLEEIPILPESSFRSQDYEVMDSLQLVHYLRAEILEVEKSELFQELLERMTSALKKRARLRGAQALTRLEHRITPLRLPSQYQLEMSACLLKKSNHD